MAGRRHPKSVGTYGLLDVLRQPARCIPPDPVESLRDVHAVECGEIRRVSCFVRRWPGSRFAPFRQGSLEISAAGAVWRPFIGIRRRARDLGITGVALVRQAECSDGGLAGPSNSHLFSLVRCTAQERRTDLLVPTADVPLVTWRFGAGEHALINASHLSVAARPVMSTRERHWRAALGVTFLAVAVIIIIIAGQPEFAFVPMVLGWLLVASALFAPRRKRRNSRSG